MKSLIRNIQLSIIFITVAAPLNALAQDEERIVLITGANRGIGLEFTDQYLEGGWTVIATARKPEKAEDLKQLQKQYPEQLSIMDVVSQRQLWVTVY